MNCECIKTTHTKLNYHNPFSLKLARYGNNISFNYSVKQEYIYQRIFFGYPMALDTANKKTPCGKLDLLVSSQGMCQKVYGC